jgi:hypothetical protein
MALGVPSAVVLTVAGHRCGNLGLLVCVARGLLDSSRAGSVLLTSDRVESGPRMMAGDLSVLSDGAAAALATARRPHGAQPAFRVHRIAVSADSRGGTADVSPAAQRRTVQLGRSAVAGLRPEKFTYVLVNPGYSDGIGELVP